MKKTLSQWLEWQATLNPKEIDLGLDRVRRVLDCLSVETPVKGIFTVGGTNGKGSTVAFIERLCAANGYSTAAYTSPHLVKYNERMRLDGTDVDDAWLIEQFEAVDAARGDTPLTYFEFGTLAALRGFSQEKVDTWILEVGLGGRLDAVNIIDPDVSVVTTIALDHQDWLGETIDSIAAEKAGILRRDRPAFFGDAPVPEGFSKTADDIGARLSCYDIDFGFARQGKQWTWWGTGTRLERLPLPQLSDPVQLQNNSVALAAVEAFNPDLLQRPAVERVLATHRLPGRFQIVENDRQWIIDVAHNPQAAELLRHRLFDLDDPRPMTVVIGLLEDKNAEGFVAPLIDLADRWLVCSVAAARGLDAAELAATIERVGGRDVTVVGPVEQFFDAALEASEPGERVLVTGSFHIAGPALSCLVYTERPGS